MKLVLFYSIPDIAPCFTCNMFVVILGSLWKSIGICKYYAKYLSNCKRLQRQL